MALSRRTGTRFQASIWPGFVDAMTGLLLVLMFVLTIFMVVQFVLRETISGQKTELDTLSTEVAALSEALGLEQDQNAALTTRVGELTSTLGDLRDRATQQQAALKAANIRIASFEEQVAGLLSEKDRNLARIGTLDDEKSELLSEQEQLQLALADLRDEVSAQEEQARLAAAKRAALQALIADLKQEKGATEQALSEEEQSRLVEAAAAEALRKRLENADAELTAMSLALEEQRRKAEETLAQLAAAETAQADLDERLAAALLARDEAAEKAGQVGDLQAQLEAAREAAQSAEELRRDLASALAAKIKAEEKAETQLTKAEERAALLSQAQTELDKQEEIASAAQKQQLLLNRQVAALRDQLSELQALLDDGQARDAAKDIRIETLGQDLNTALARAAAEERRRRELEEEKNQRLAEEKKDLARYRSEFFGRLRDVLGQQEGVRIVGDRFVFSSEVLFPPGSADLSGAGEGEIAKVAGILRNVMDEIPEGIDWVIRVDGHTDNVPISSPEYADNWELSQARALSVVRYMISDLGIPPARLAANGFGQYQPVANGNSPEARAQNRRIELKLTEK